MEHQSCPVNSIKRILFLLNQVYQQVFQNVYFFLVVLFCQLFIARKKLRLTWDFWSGLVFYCGIVVCLWLTSLQCAAQTQPTIGITGACGYTDRLSLQNTTLDLPSNEADQTVSDILNHTGLAKNFILKSSNIPNAAAIIYDKKRYILYNPSFIEKLISQTSTDWGAVSILAHEIGHHLQGHTLQTTGSQPDLELEADEFSGFILAKMGANLTDAQIAVATFASQKGSKTHPPRDQRLQAIAEGWHKANTQLKSSSLIPAPLVAGSNYLARCYFIEDKVAYYITDTYEIIACPDETEAQVIGKLLPISNTELFPDLEVPATLVFQWQYKTTYCSYFIDQNGDIYRINEFSFEKVGNMQGVISLSSLSSLSNDELKD